MKTNKILTMSTLALSVFAFAAISVAEEHAAPAEHTDAHAAAAAGDAAASDKKVEADKTAEHHATAAADKHEEMNAEDDGMDTDSDEAMNDEGEDSGDE